VTVAEDEKTFSAKQVATRIGTDAKSLRKFFRDPNSGYTPVGQGARYDFPESEIAKIKTAFDAWSSGKTTRNRPTKTASPASRGTTTPRPREPKVRPEEGRHGNAMDDDDIITRTTYSTAERMEKHGLTFKGGRFIPRPRPGGSPSIEEAAKILNPYPPIETIPGLHRPHNELQAIIDAAEGEYEGPSDEDIMALLGED
jgi:hypothetical protein